MSAQVLLADDDVELAGMLKEYLEREGFGVATVHDGEAAARLALSGGYQIVVLDVMMPKQDGIETLRQIRQTSRVPVVMLTARGDDVDRIVGLEPGADHYWPNPCTPRGLAPRAPPASGSLGCAPSCAAHNPAPRADRSRSAPSSSGRRSDAPNGTRASWC